MEETVDISVFLCELQAVTSMAGREDMLRKAGFVLNLPRMRYQLFNEDELVWWINVEELNNESSHVK